MKKSGKPRTSPTRRTSIESKKTQVSVSLTPMQEAFVREYLIDKNGTKAAVRAGYEEKHAASQAYQLLHKTPVLSAIRERLIAQYKRLDLTAERILSELMLIATADISDAYDDKGNLLPMKEIPEHLRRAIAGVEVDEIWAGHGEDRTQIGYTKKLKLWDKRGALEILAKNLKLLTDKVEHEHTHKGTISHAIQQMTPEEKAARTHDIEKRLKLVSG